MYTHTHGIPFFKLTIHRAAFKAALPGNTNENDHHCKTILPILSLFTINAWCWTCCRCPSIILNVLTPESEDKPWRSIKPGYNRLLNSILQSLLIDNLSPSCCKCNVTNHFGAAGKCIRMAPQEQVYLPARAQWPTADPQEITFSQGEKSSPFKLASIGESINVLY